MTAEREKWLAALMKLIQKTQENEIQWRPIEPAGVGLGPSSAIIKAFETIYRGQRIVVYHIDQSRMIGRRGYPVGLRFVDHDGRLQWQSPDLDALRDLFAAIEYRSARIEDVIEALIND